MPNVVALYPFTPKEIALVRMALRSIPTRAAETLDERLALPPTVSIEAGWGGGCPTCGTYVHRDSSK